jgi:hypothetical protein
MAEERISHDAGFHHKAIRPYLEFAKVHSSSDLVENEVAFLPPGAYPVPTVTTFTMSTRNVVSYDWQTTYCSLSLSDLGYFR